MDVIKKHHKIISFLTLFLLLFISVKLQLNFILQSLSTLVVVIMFVYITKSALVNLLDCLCYLAILAPVIGFTIGYYANKSGYFPSFPFSDYVYSIVAYFIIWLIIVFWGDLKTVKLATLIIAQFLTALFIIINLIMKLLPISVFDEFIIASGVNLKEMKDVLGYDSRTAIETTLQLILYPALFNALIIYLFAEIKQYCTEKLQSLNDN